MDSYSLIHSIVKGTFSTPAPTIDTDNDMTVDAGINATRLLSTVNGNVGVRERYIENGAPWFDD